MGTGAVGEREGVAVEEESDNEGSHAGNRDFTMVRLDKPCDGTSEEDCANEEDAGEYSAQVDERSADIEGSAGRLSGGEVGDHSRSGSRHGQPGGDEVEVEGGGGGEEKSGE